MDNEQACFNLIDEPWIVVKLLSGETSELSMLEVFRRADTIERLANELPTQDFAILRVLLAVIQRSTLSMAEEYDYPSDAWGALWEARKLPIDEIESYLDEWHDRFDLFDDEQPFMQVAGLESVSGELAGIEPLLLISKNKNTLFSTRSLRGIESLSFSEAARWLIHAHAYDVQSPRMAVVGDPLVKNGKRYKRGTGWAGNLGGVYIEGQTLAQTLLLNLVLCVDCYDGLDDFITDEDLPVWEQPQKGPGDEMRMPRGYADIYTWQSKRIRLIVANGRVVNTIFTNGNELKADNLCSFEPMTMWQLKGEGKDSVLSSSFVPCQHKSSKTFLQGMAPFISSRSNDNDLKLRAPGIILWLEYLSSLNGGRCIDQSEKLVIHVTGLLYEQKQRSKVEECIDDVTIVNAYLLSKDSIIARTLVERCLKVSDRAVRILGLFAWDLVVAGGGSIEGRDAKRKKDTEKRDKKKRDKIISRTTAEAYFELDVPFRSWLSALDSSTDLDQAEVQWYTQVRNIIIRLAKRLIEEAGPDAIVGRAAKIGNKETWLSAGNAERLFHYLLNESLPYERGADESEKEG